MDFVIGLFRTSSRGLALLVLCLAPLPFGSVEIFWIATGCILLAISLALDPLPRPGVSLGPVFAALAAAAGLGLLVWLQTRSPPLVGQADPVWELARNALGSSLEGRVSPSVSGPWLAIGASLLFILAFIRGYGLGAERRQARLLLIALGSAGIAVALYGMASLALWPDRLLGRDKTAYLGSLTGTFVNRNTAATFLGSCSLIWLTLGLTVFRDGFGHVADRGALGKLLLSPPRPLLICLGASAICLAGTALTGSRAGLLLTVLMGCLVLMLHGATRPISRRARLAAPVFALAGGALLFEMIGGQVGQRLARGGLTDEARLEVYRAGSELIAARPWLGWGLGSFELVFPEARPAALGSFGIWDRAHNTLLEIAIELGAPAALAVLALWLAALFILARACRPIGSLGAPTVPLAALAVLLLGGLHALVDFSLQIPGYAVLYAAVIGAGIAQALSMRARLAGGPPVQPPTLQRAPARAIAATAEHLPS